MSDALALTFGASSGSTNGIALKFVSNSSSNQYDSNKHFYVDANFDSGWTFACVCVTAYYSTYSYSGGTGSSYSTDQRSFPKYFFVSVDMGTLDVSAPSFGYNSSSSSYTASTMGLQLVPDTSKCRVLTTSTYYNNSSGRNQSYSSGSLEVTAAFA